jgi:hypothetical protein
LSSDQAFELLLSFPTIQGFFLAGMGILLGLSGAVISYQMTWLNRFEDQLLSNLLETEQVLHKLSGVPPDYPGRERAARELRALEAQQKRSALRFHTYRYRFANYARTYLVAGSLGFLFGASALWMMLGLEIVVSIAAMWLTWLVTISLAVGFAVLIDMVLAEVTPSPPESTSTGQQAVRPSKGHRKASPDSSR